MTAERIESLRGLVYNLRLGKMLDEPDMLAALDLAEEALRLRSLIPLARSYARQNPRHFFNGQWNDPDGVHGVLEAIDAALAKPATQGGER
jgi:hypothetical protein